MPPVTAAAADGDAEPVRLLELDCPPAGDRPGRPGAPSPAMVTVMATSAAVMRTLDDAQVVDQLGDDRRGDGDPRLASRTAGDAHAETDALIREGRACRRQRHADAGGRSQAVARRAARNRSTVAS